MIVVGAAAVYASDPATADKRFSDWSKWLEANPDHIDAVRPHVGDIGLDIATQWRASAMKAVVSSCEAGICEDRDVYEFGVYSGRSLRAISQYLRHHNISFRKLWGFDSFQGLPAEGSTLGAKARYRMPPGGYDKGTYNASALLQVGSSAKLQQWITRYVDDPRLSLIEGFYSDSLTPERARRMKPAIYVDLDCDLYSSTTQALEWLMAHALISAGTIVGYDDWKASGGRNSGQQKAHHELVDKHGLKVRALPRPPVAQGY